MPCSQGPPTPGIPRRLWITEGSVVAAFLLNPNISYHHSPRHMPPPCPNVTDIANPVGKQPRDGEKSRITNGVYGSNCGP